MKKNIKRLTPQFVVCINNAGYPASLELHKSIKYLSLFIPIYFSTSDSKDPTAAHSKNPDGFQNLMGRWLRPDGGYIIEIRGITKDGRMDAAYLNPRPIPVAQAEASWKSGKLQVFIELRDTGYPGSTYTLDYNPGQDVLTGIYFQAAVNQAFEVVFVRAK